MKTLLLALTLLLAVGTLALADTNPLLLLYQNMKAEEAQLTVTEHPKRYEPVEVNKLSGLMPPYFAKRYLRGERYTQWALTWNAYHDETANRARSERTLFGTTTTIMNTTNGTIITSKPRFWTSRSGVPGVIRYNPFFNY